MINIKNIKKVFDDIVALKDFSLIIEDGVSTIIVGENGAGKSTLLKLIAGILKVDNGTIDMDGEIVFENEKIKSNIFYLPDDLFFVYSDITEIMNFYKKFYKNFDIEYAKNLFLKFNLDIKRPINKYSKGMKKQASFLMAISAKTKYLLCDEVFDGVDKNAKKQLIDLINDEINTRQFTPLFTTHNINEMGDIKGKIVSLERHIA